MPESTAWFPSTIADIVAHWAVKTPERIALTEGSRTITYGALNRAVADTAAILRRAGLRSGDRAMLVCENCCAAIVTYLALVEIAAWPIIVNARLSHREIEDIREHAQVRRTIYTVDASVHARTHSDHDGAVTIESVALGTISLGPLNGAVRTEPAVADPAERIAALIYTTGTTGRPKGVMLSHRNILFVARASSEVRALGPEDRVYAVLPISHILGLTGIVVSTLLCGGRIALASRFDPRLALQAILREGVTVMVGTPTMYGMLAEYATKKQVAPVTGSLRLISSAGAPLDAATKRAAENAFGLTLHNGYGITETAPTLSLTRLDAPRADCSVGRLLPSVEAKITDSDGTEVASGEAGELLVRGPGVMKGYYKSPEETALAIDGDGWFRTGDVARIEDDHLFIVGRSKEMIIRFGFNVYPAEIESVLNAHPHVARSAVVGRQTACGEEIVAFVEPKPGAPLSQTDIVAHCSARLTSYKQPSLVILIAAMPLSPAGKILKRALPAIGESAPADVVRVAMSA